MEAARARAVEFAVDMTAASVLEQRRINLHHRIEGTSESGQDVLTDIRLTFPKHCVEGKKGIGSRRD
jgi:hypothetical protein